MSNRPPLNWNTVLRDLKADRATRQPIREERLRVAQGLRGTAALALSGWRGNSGRRYVVAIHTLADFDPAEAEGAVVLFVARDAGAPSRIVMGGSDLDSRNLAGLLDQCRLYGWCDEVHVHRLAEEPTERAAIVTDLAAPQMEVA